MTTFNVFAEVLNISPDNTTTIDKDIERIQWRIDALDERINKFLRTGKTVSSGMYTRRAILVKAHKEAVAFRNTNPIKARIALNTGLAE